MGTMDEASRQGKKKRKEKKRKNRDRESDVINITPASLSPNGWRNKLGLSL
jgi:hypothetical protein